MRRLFLILPALFLLSALAISADEAIEVKAPGGPIVVELFTSEGCSSCPPADRLFARLEGDVVPLAFHVDYWNHLGWRDPFSDARWSARQRRYGDVFERGYVYTPQLVVNGRAEAVGSDRGDVRSMLENAAATRPAASFELAVGPGGEGLAVAVDGRLGQGARHPATVFLAITESELEIDVRAGENRNRTLRHQHVVRELREIGTLEAGGRLEESLVLPLAKDWRREHLGVVVFAQDEASLEIHGAAMWRAAETP